MDLKSKRTYEYVFIHVAKIRIKEGWALFLCSMDSYSHFAFKPVFVQNTEITIEALNQLFRNILEDYKPNINPEKITFVTSLPEEYGLVLLITIAGKHNFVFNKKATLEAMSEFLNNLNIELIDL